MFFEVLGLTYHIPITTRRRHFPALQGCAAACRRTWCDWDSESRLRPCGHNIGFRELDPCASERALSVAVDCDVRRYCV